MQFSLPCVLFVIIDILYDFFIRQSAKRLLTTGHKTSVETFQLEVRKIMGNLPQKYGTPRQVEFGV